MPEAALGARASTTSRMPRAPRLAGVDVARGLALVGMFAAHTIARDGAETIANGRSSVLFATLAGVSIGLMTGGPRTDGVPRQQARIGILVRGMLLFVLGTILWLPRTDIAVILDYYGIGFVLLLPFLFVRRISLAISIGVVAVVGTALVAQFGETQLTDATAQWALDRVVSGYYPMAAWLAYLLAGLLVARCDLTKLTVQAGMLMGGFASLVLGYYALPSVLPWLTVEAHSDTIGEVLGAGGTAIAVLGALLLVTDPRGGVATRIVRVVTWPLGAAGSMPLSLYTAQLVLLAVWIAAAPDPYAVEYPLWMFLAFTIGSLVVASVWRATLGAGPLERALRSVSGWPRSRTPEADGGART